MDEKTSVIRLELLEAIESLRAEGRIRRFLRHQVLVADRPESAREMLFKEAKNRGLLFAYEFSGVPAEGLSRRDAITTLMLATFQKAFYLLRKNLGSSAKFFSRPKQLRDVDVDFYWKKARFGLVITGPTFDDLRRGDDRRTRDREEILRRLSWYKEFAPKYLHGIDLSIVPYYEIWHRPMDFVANVQDQLIKSGQYQRLIKKT